MAFLAFMSRGFVGRKTYTCSPKHYKNHPLGYGIEKSCYAVVCRSVVDLADRDLMLLFPCFLSTFY